MKKGYGKDAILKSKINFGGNLHMESSDVVETFGPVIAFVQLS